MSAQGGSRQPGHAEQGDNNSDIPRIHRYISLPHTTNNKTQAKGRVPPPPPPEFGAFLFIVEIG